MGVFGVKLSNVACMYVYHFCIHIGLFFQFFFKLSLPIASEKLVAFVTVIISNRHFI